MSQLTVSRKLPKPWKVGGKIAKDIELREPTLEDYIEAEKDGNPTFAPHAFHAALAARTVVRAGDFTGPFAPGHFRTMPIPNWRVVRELLSEAEELGEDEPADPTPSV